MRFKKRRYGLMYHNLPCCGKDRWFLEIKLYFKLIFFGETFIHCPICDNTRRYVLVNHIVPDDTKELLKQNKKLHKNIEDVWKNS